MAAKKAVKKDLQPLVAGRRKCSIARVRVTPNGTGKFAINGKTLEEYFGLSTLQYIVKQPLVLTGNEDKVDIFVNVCGGGLTGQAGAIRQGISRGLLEINESYRAELKKAGFLTRDSRQKERKKYGLKKARKAPQYSKR